MCHISSTTTTTKKEKKKKKEKYTDCPANPLTAAVFSLQCTECNNEPGGSFCMEKKILYP